MCHFIAIVASNELQSSDTDALVHSRFQTPEPLAVSVQKDPGSGWPCNGDTFWISETDSAANRESITILRNPAAAQTPWFCEHKADVWCKMDMGGGGGAHVEGGRMCVRVVLAGLWVPARLARAVGLDGIAVAMRVCATNFCEASSEEDERELLRLPQPDG
eukprot:COSAG04_NODE_132_length_24268_cov_7.633426_9_plen_161_part_00